MIKCDKCGKELEYVNVLVFLRDGSDTWDKHPLFEIGNNGCVGIETNANWTGYELTDKERRETIECPFCKKFPFGKEEIQVYDSVNLICFSDKVCESQSEHVIKGSEQYLNWLIVAAFRYCVSRHTTQAMYGVDKVILDNIGLLHTEFIKQFIYDIELEQHSTEIEKNYNRQYATNFFKRLQDHVGDYRRCLREETSEKAKELCKALDKVMKLIPQVDMTHRWQHWEHRVDDTTYLTPMLNKLKAELQKREEGTQNV